MSGERKGKRREEGKADREKGGRREKESGRERKSGQGKRESREREKKKEKKKGRRKRPFKKPLFFSLLIFQVGLIRFDNRRAERQQPDEIRDHHQAVETVGQLPYQIHFHYGA